MKGKFTSLVQGINTLLNWSKKAELTESTLSYLIQSEVLTNTTINNLNPVHPGSEKPPMKRSLLPAELSCWFPQYLTYHLEKNVCCFKKPTDDYPHRLGQLQYTQINPDDTILKNSEHEKVNLCKNESVRRERGCDTGFAVQIAPRHSLQILFTTHIPSH